jgi:hypothetical protein
MQSPKSKDSVETFENSNKLGGSQNLQRLSSNGGINGRERLNSNTNTRPGSKSPAAQSPKIINSVSLGSQKDIVKHGDRETML